MSVSELALTVMITLKFLTQEKLQRKQSLEDYSVKHEASIDMPVYMCNQCDYESIFLDTLKRHIGFKHGSDKHVCSYCGAALMSKHSLQERWYD